MSETISEALDDQSNQLIAEVTTTLNTYNEKYKNDIVLGFTISNKTLNKVLDLYEINYLTMLNYKTKSSKQLNYTLHSLVKSKLSTVKSLED